MGCFVSDDSELGCACAAESFVVDKTDYDRHITGQTSQIVLELKIFYQSNNQTFCKFSHSPNIPLKFTVCIYKIHLVENIMNS